MFFKASFLFLFLLSGLATAREQIIKDKYLVIFKKNLYSRNDTPEKVRESAKALVQKQKGKVHHTYTKVFNGFSATLNASAMMALMRNPNVQEIVPDRTISLELPQPSYVQTSPTWGIDRIDQRAKSLDSKYNYQFTGAGVKAYIIDSGINFDHAELEGRASFGFDAFSDGRNGLDCNGHGTHVAGTVGSKTYGVAKGVSLIAVRVLDCNGSGSLSGVVAGMDWVGANNSGPAVVNMSLGASKNLTLNQAVASLSALNVNVVVAAGNSNLDACNSSPASAPAAITVGASDSSDIRASFSNYGNCVDLFAPGVSITSIWNSSNSALAVLNGTSMASPHVAGVAALYLEENPSLTSAKLTEAIAGASTKYAISSSRSVNNHLVHSFNIQAPTLPKAPSNLTATYSSTSGITLKWSDLSNNESGFEIYRAVGTGAFSSLVVLPSNAITYSDKNVSRGTKYTYQVRSFNSTGASAFSKAVSFTIR